MSSKKTVKVTTKPKVVKMTTQTVKKQEKKVTSSAEVSKPKTTQNKTALLGAPGNKNPWKDGSKILSIEVTDDFYINMAMAPKQTLPGAWGTIKSIPNVDYARNVLAITPEFKKEISHVQKYLVKKGTRVQIGIAGPQQYGGREYLGGGTQVEILPRPSARYLLPSGEPDKIN
ncbi:hypothetical protein [Gallibacter sp. Marseille-QA0791]|uniref:hypothetical protein n=1 Tax=Gallibacter sp. Marseille-QA0791 TaxID=3378781 RepID=UPI003D0D2A4A